MKPITLVSCRFGNKQNLFIWLFLSDNVCIDSMSVKVTRRVIDKSTVALQELTKIIRQ
jgi:hypothetical protein